VELGVDTWRDYCLGRLDKKFPTSVRVERLKGIKAEGVDDWVEAQNIYTKILADKPEDGITRKRLIAMHKQRGKTAEAIEQLNKYLETFSIDAEVWHELAELYITAGLLSRAVFCFEELLMSNPRSMYHILTYAELLYSTGDFDLSRKHFSLAAYLDRGCLRALCGIYVANIALADKERNKEKMDELQKLGIGRLKALYKDIGGSHGKVAHSLLMVGHPS